MKKFFLFLTLLTLSVGQMWGMNSNYTIGSQVTSLVDGDYVAWGTANNNLATSISSNWVYCGSTKADWIVFKVVKISNAFYLQNTADNKYVYSSAAKKVAFDSSNKTAITLSSVSGKGYLVNGGSSIGNYTFNSSGIRPYASSNYDAANLYKVNAFAVTYNANGADGGTVPTDNGNYLSGATVTAKSNSGSLTRTGYNFVGWNTRADGNGTNIAATGSATFSITASTTLYAKWESAVSCTSEITIEQGTPSNGSFSMTPTGDVCIDEGNASVTLSDIEAASGYRFKEITSSGGGTINNNAKTVTNISASTTINVVFEQIPSHKAYFYNGATLLNTGGTSVQEGAAVSYSGSVPESCDTGTGASTTFAGWADGTWDGKVAKNAIVPNFYESTLPVMGDGDVTYHAVFCKGGSQTGGITQAEITTASNGKTAGTYGAQSASSASGNWTGNYAWNTQNEKKVMQLNATSGNSIISPTFAGNISKIEFTYTNGSGSNRNFYIKNGSDDIGTISASSSTTEGTGSVDNITGSYTSFAITASGALYIHSIRVTYGSEASNYMTTCCTPLGQINGSFFWSTLFEPLIPDKFRSHVLLCNHLFSSSHHRIPPHLIYTMYISRDFGFF